MSELNSKNSIDALLSPHPLKLGEILILDKYDSPCTSGDFNDMLENGFACWILKQKRDELFKLSRSEALAKASEWIDTLNKSELIAEIRQLVDGVAAFYKTLPKSDETQKKTTNEAMDLS